MLLLRIFDRGLVFGKFFLRILKENSPTLVLTFKELLFNDGEPWVKKIDNKEFDVPVGCFDGAEICELVGIYNLHLLKIIITK